MRNICFLRKIDSPIAVAAEDPQPLASIRRSPRLAKKKATVTANSVKFSDPNSQAGPTRSMGR